MAARLRVSIAGNPATIGNFQSALERHFIGFCMSSASVGSDGQDLVITWDFGKMLEMEIVPTGRASAGRGRPGRPKGTRIVPL